MNESWRVRRGNEDDWGLTSERWGVKNVWGIRSEEWGIKSVRNHKAKWREMKRSGEEWGGEETRSSLSFPIVTAYSSLLTDSSHLTAYSLPRSATLSCLDFFFKPSSAHSASRSCPVRLLTTPAATPATPLLWSRKWSILEVHCRFWSLI